MDATWQDEPGEEGRVDEVVGASASIVAALG